jgi:hypothetical protein
MRLKSQNNTTLFLLQIQNFKLFAYLQKLYYLCPKLCKITTLLYHEKILLFDALSILTLLYSFSRAT